MDCRHALDINFCIDTGLSMSGVMYLFDAMMALQCSGITTEETNQVSGRHAMKVRFKFGQAAHYLIQ